MLDNIRSVFSRLFALCLRRWSLLRICVYAVLVALVGSAIALMLMDRAEQREFEALVRDARGADAAVRGETDVLTIMSVVNQRLKGIQLPPQPEAEAPLPVPIRSSHDHLQSPTGACASYSHVLAKALMTAGYDVRKVGLGKDGALAIHHVIEARIGSSWVLLDAFYNQAFRARAGHLVDAAAVHSDWAWFRQQVPADYDSRFDYSTYYYTNWSRIPMVGRVVMSSPRLHGWLHEHRVSVRFWFFNTYRWMAFLSVMVALGAVLALWLLKRVRASHLAR